MSTETSLRQTPRCVAAIRKAEMEAIARGDDFVGAEHLLLGLMSDRSSVAYAALESLGVTEEQVRTSVGRFLP